MSKEIIDSKTFGILLRNGADNLYAHRQAVNDMNVFPIPDGDTGDNMFMTISSGVGTLSEDYDALSEAAREASRGMLLGARGNSGVILSRFFAGVSRGFASCTTADVHAVSEAFKCGVDEAYNAVAVPVEGTILTVLKDSVRYAETRIRENTGIEEYFDNLVSEMRRSLERTPELLDVLKQSGVVDSGGAGLLYIVEGMQQGLSGDLLETSYSTAEPAARKVNLDMFTENDVLEFGYCTEFLLRLTHAKTDIEAFSLDEFKAYLESVGDSIVCFREDTIIKVHVHTMNPGAVLEHCQQYGEFLTLKIENMTLQHHETFDPVKKPHKQYGFVAVAAGEGLQSTFLSLGCDEIVDGGQSMNPSAKDLVTAFEKINADTIFVFPNNSNIVMTAEQAASLYDKADIRIIPTRSVGEGYAALSMLDTTLPPEDIIREAGEVIASIVTGAVSTASRDAETNGFSIHPGDSIGFSRDKILACESCRNDASIALAKALHAEDFGVLMVIAGKHASDSDREALRESLAREFPDVETFFIDGGQPIYDYVLTLM